MSKMSYCDNFDNFSPFHSILKLVVWFAGFTQFFFKIWLSKVGAETKTREPNRNQQGTLNC